MLLDKKAGTIAYERANTVRSVEYMRNMISEGPINDRITEVYEQSISFDESAEDQDILHHFNANGDEDKDAEIQRILESVEDMSFDEMIGLETSADAYCFEGTNTDLLKIRVTYIKPIKKKIKEARKAIKAGNYDEAKKTLKDVKSDLEKILEVVKNMDNSNGEKMIGGFLQSLTTIISYVVGLALIIASAGVGYSTGGIVTYLSGIGVIVGGPLADAIRIGDRIGEFRKDTSSPSMDKGGWQQAIFDSVNVNQAYVYGLTKDLIRFTDNLIKRIDNVKSGKGEKSISGLDNLKTVKK